MKLIGMLKKQVEETDNKEIIKNKEIVQHMERTTDMAKHVGKIIKTIIVKYA